MDGSLHRLSTPTADDRRLIDVTVSELRALVREAVAEVHRRHEPERPMTVKQLAALYGVDPDRVREWVKKGMPHFRTGDVRGLRIWPDGARVWLERHRG